MAVDDVLFAGGRRLDETARANIRRRWAWYVALGFALVALGVLAMSSSMLATFIAVRLFGWALLAAGVLEVGHALWEDRWRGASLAVIAGALYVVIGTAMIAFPERSAIALTLLVGVFLVVQGTLRVIVSLANRDPGWGWTLFHGLVSLALGAVVWTRWPISGQWVLGLFVGIEIALTGVTVAMLGIFAHREDKARAPSDHEPERAPPGGAHAPAV